MFLSRAVMICSQEVSAGTGEGKKRATLEWRLAAGQGRGGWEFLLLKLTQPKSGEAGNQGGTRQRCKVPHASRPQEPATEGLFLGLPQCHSHKNLYLEKEAVVRNTTY